MCEWIKARDDKALIATGEVGYLGYFTDNPILDLGGLVTPGIICSTHNEFNLKNLVTHRTISYSTRREFDDIFHDAQPRFYIDFGGASTFPRKKTIGGIPYAMQMAKYTYQDGKMYVLYEHEN